MTEAVDRLKTALADRYAIESELGAGGMATVYLAEDLRHHRKVAVKVLKPRSVRGMPCGISNSPVGCCGFKCRYWWSRP